LATTGAGMIFGDTTFTGAGAGLPLCAGAALAAGLAAIADFEVTFAAFGAGLRAGACFAGACFLTGLACLLVAVFVATLRPVRIRAPI
jgi:hypothetical protein